MCRRSLMSSLFILLFCSILISVGFEICRNVKSNNIYRRSIKMEPFISKYSSTESSIWQNLTVAANQVFKEQNDLEVFSSSRKQENYVIILFQTSALESVTVFMDSMSVVMPHIQYVTFLLKDEPLQPENIDQIKSVFIDTRNIINTVIVFIENNTSVEKLMKVVSATPDLRLSGIIHTTEWMIVSTEFKSEILSDLSITQQTVDFITFLFKCSLTETCVAQKSRNKSLRVTARVRSNAGLCVNLTSSTESLSGPLGQRIQGNIRKTAMIFLRSQKSILSGMNMPVAWLDVDIPNLAVYNRNENSVEGYSASLLKLIVTIFDMSFHIVAEGDGDHYGKGGLKDNASGVISLLARREAAFTTLPISRTDFRQPVIDFVPVTILFEPVYIIYRVSEPNNTIDLIYVNIFKPKLVYILIGPVLALALIGALVHVASRSCSLEHPVALSMFEARHLLTYPKHIFFHDSITYPGQTGRVLRVTWSLFWLIICSAYVAFLATEFTTKTPETPINTVQKLTETTDFKLGIAGTSSALLQYLQLSTNSTLQTLWKRIVEQNLTENITFDDNYNNHIKKVLEGHYVFINGGCIAFGTCDDSFADYWPEIRIYQQHFSYMAEWSYVATPKNVFYYDELYKVLLDFEEMGFLQYLRNFHFRPNRRINHATYGINKENKVVTLLRILLPVYITIGGVSFSVTCLMIEIMYSRWRSGGFRMV